MQSQSWQLVYNKLNKEQFSFCIIFNNNYNRLISFNVRRRM